MAHYQELPPQMTGVSTTDIVMRDKVGRSQSYSTHRAGADGFIFQYIVAEATPWGTDSFSSPSKHIDQDSNFDWLQLDGIGACYSD